jgi:hypothetical protein
MRSLYIYKNSCGGGQIEMHTADLLIPEPSKFEVESDIAMLRRYKSLSSGQILAKLIETEDEMIWSDILKVINSIWSKEIF